MSHPSFIQVNTAKGRGYLFANVSLVLVTTVVNLWAGVTILSKERTRIHILIVCDCVVNVLTSLNTLFLQVLIFSDKKLSTSRFSPPGACSTLPSPAWSTSSSSTFSHYGTVSSRSPSLASATSWSAMPSLCTTMAGRRRWVDGSPFFMTFVVLFVCRAAQLVAAWQLGCEKME